MGDNPYLVGLAIAVVLTVFSFILLLVKRYKRCPSNRILVIYGKVKQGESARCLHGGGAFVWPLIQHFDYLSLDPMQIEIPLRGALSVENIRVNVPSVFTVAIGTESEAMHNAAIRLLGLPGGEIVKQAEDIIFGQLRQVIASMKIEDINRDRDKFLESIQSSLEMELEKIGLVLINVNITDITDESGYIEAIGKKAASEAIQQATVDVAQQEKIGAIGVSEAEREQAIEVANATKFREIGTKEAERDQAIQVAEYDKQKSIGESTAKFQQESQVREAERNMRIKVADANAKAVAGENLSKAEVAQANATLKVEEAQAYQKGETSLREAEAAVQEAQYNAQARAAEALATKIEAEKRAELEAVAKAAKAKQIVDAHAQAEENKILAEGEAAAIFAKLEAQAKGQYEILRRKGEGLKEIVDGCGGSEAAFKLLMIEEMEHLSANAAKAISNIKFDKVVVWDGGGGNGKAGESGTSNFLKGLAHSIPPMLNVMRDIGGVEMPEFFGKLVNPEENGSGVAPESNVSAQKDQKIIPPPKGDKGKPGD